jgi:hypothetical protein
VRSGRVLIAVSVIVGAALGCATSFGQGLLDRPFAALANSASAWLVAPFLLGRSAREPRFAAFTGAVVCLSELAGYYATSLVRGYAVGDHTLVLFWIVCGVLGGPVLAVAGWANRTPGLVGQAAPLILAACFAIEGLRYAKQLGQHDTAMLWFAIAAGIIAITGVLALQSTRRRHRAPGNPGP